MIITITGKPCTGKSTMAEIFIEKYGFERVYAGRIFKEKAKELGMDILDLAKSDKVYVVDKQVDTELENIYKTRFHENLLIESRTSWSFMPKAFNVFIDIPDQVMAERLFNSDRSVEEKGSTIEEALIKVTERYYADIARYKMLYNIDCGNLDNYDFVIDNTNLTPEQTADAIYKEYFNYLAKQEISK